MRARAGEARVVRRLTLIPVLAVVLGAAACTSSSGSPSAGPGTSSAVRGATGQASGQVLWLCRPGLSGNPCTVSPDATSVSPSGARTAEPAQGAANPPFECFYVYPTVIRGTELNAPLQVQPVIRKTAIEQASRFSQVCQVWAPVYRQATDRGLLSSMRPNSTVAQVAYSSVLSAWREFLAHSDGKPIIVIGHSQGASVLIKLLQQEVDPDPAMRARLVSALLIGGNVQVPDGRTVGGTFGHLPLCTTPGQVGCVIAYSSFSQTPPPDSQFGIAGRGVSWLSGQFTSTGQQVACVNPAAIGGGTAPLRPYFASPNAAGSDATWVTYPRLYTAACTTKGNITWLQVTDVAGASDLRPIVQETHGSTFGLHTYDVNLALGNLVQDVRAQEASYISHH
jgi:Protein of unknown function (DUF3089)